MLVRLALAALLLALSACQAVPAPGVVTPIPTPAGGVDTGGTFRVAIAADSATLDPWNANDANTLIVTRQIFETLVEYEPLSFKVGPKLAESWSVSSDGLVWTFALRRGVKFHDGTNLDAAAVALNFERARQVAHPLRGPAGVERYRAYAALLEGFDDASVIATVEAKDAATVVITTRVPFGPLLADLAVPSFAIVSPKSMRDDPAGWSMSVSAGAAGTGPFLFRPGSWQPGQQIALERNASYWTKDPSGAALPYVDRVVFRVVKEETARIAELRSGNVDTIRDVTPATLPTVKADPNLLVIARPAFNSTYLGIAGGSAPLDKLEVRRAIAMAIDKPLLAAVLYSGGGLPASQLLAPGMFGYDDSVVEFYRYDVAAAKRLLTDAGFGNGFATELWYPSAWRAQYPDPRRVAESVAADLARIGITAAVRSAEPTAYRADGRGAAAPLDRDARGRARSDSSSPHRWWGGDGCATVRRGVRAARASAPSLQACTKLIQPGPARIPRCSRPFVAATRRYAALASPSASRSSAGLAREVTSATLRIAAPGLR